METNILNSRRCYECGKEIFECMGSVHAGDLLEFMRTGLKGPVRELCPRCVTTKTIWFMNNQESSNK